MLCANITDKEGCPVLDRSVVLEPLPGVRVGVTAVLGPEAWDVTPTHLRENLLYSDYVSAAVSS
eukprot:CAMPEP_0185761900 /NCGR_PEP_ID=MMETSP1174-20130828/20847_1 /TAXON_ID=35687 /ORGANISM="Dictyocha speculum, Strain CCMP1381" /LENGTH=63 /DNA_ID=CAMNT_0028443329 /DNA_START=24 /DNA_END=212 /DNA_ORIENTATION=-